MLPAALPNGISISQDGAVVFICAICRAALCLPETFYLPLKIYLFISKVFIHFLLSARAAARHGGDDLPVMMHSRSSISLSLLYPNISDGWIRWVDLDLSSLTRSAPRCCSPAALRCALACCALHLCARCPHAPTRCAPRLPILSSLTCTRTCTHAFTPFLGGWDR